MSRSHTNAAAVERAIATARALGIQNNRENSLSAHLIIDDMVGLVAYRKYMNCPDTETLGAYAEEAPSLPLERAVLIATHEKRCPVCASDIADMRLALRQQVSQALNSLPEWTTDLVGQEALRDQLSKQLVSGDSHLVTLTAPSGMGKTRLMLETALEQSYLFRDGIWLLPNSGTDDMDGIAASLGDMMQLGMSAKASAFDQLCEHLSNKQALIAIDGIDSRKANMSAALSQLNGCAPEVVCLTTGQSRMGLASERPFTVSPLNYLPTLSGGTLDSRVPTENLLALESVQLFTACAEQIVPTWSRLLSDESAVRATGTLCAYTAGNPLAIELAATRLQTMSPADIQRSLISTAPSLLRGEQAESPDLPLPESLQSLVAWSIGLLSTREAHLLQSLANFQERFTPEQARAIAAEEEAETLLETLRTHSLLQRWRTGSRTFYRLPDPVSQFINSQLQPETRATVSRRFVAYFGQMAQDLAPQMEDRRQLEAMRELETNLPHLRMAMETGATTGQWRTVGQIGLSIYRFLSLRGHWQECQERLRIARDAFAKIEADALTHQTELTLARCLSSQAEYSEASEILFRLHDLFDQEKDLDGIAETERGLGVLAQFQGNYQVAVPSLEKALHYYRSVDNGLRAAECRYNLGYLAWQTNDYDRANLYLTASVTTFRERGERYRLGSGLAVLGNLALEQQRLAEARAYFEESLKVREELGDIRGIASTMANLGRIWAAEGDLARAEYCLGRAQRHLELLNDRRTLAQIHLLWGELAHKQGEEISARSHFNTALDLFTRIDNFEGAGDAHIDLGRVATGAGRYQEADQHLHLALVAFHKIASSTRQAEALYRLAELRFAQGDLPTAYLYVRIAQQHLSNQPITRSKKSELQTEMDHFLTRCEDALTASHLTSPLMSTEELKELEERCRSLSLKEVVSQLLVDFVSHSDTTSPEYR